MESIIVINDFMKAVRFNDTAVPSCQYHCLINRPILCLSQLVNLSITWGQLQYIHDTSVWRRPNNLCLVSEILGFSFDENAAIKSNVSKISNSNNSGDTLQLMHWLNNCNVWDDHSPVTQWCSGKMCSGHDNMCSHDKQVLVTSDP